MLNLIYDACSYEGNNLYAIYFSLDDSKNEIIPRLIAMDQSIPIGVCSKPQRYIDMINTALDEDSEDSQETSSINIEAYEEFLRRREVGIENLKSKNNRIKIVDTNEVSNIDDMYEYIKNVITYVRAINENYKIIIGIDSINDIGLTKKLTGDETKLGEVAKAVKQWSVEFECPIFASTHIRKLNGNRRPAIDDLKDSTVLVYEASVVFIVYNDVSANRQCAKIYQMDVEAGIKEPILELDWAKNKKSSYKGRTFCYFKPEYSKTIECDSEANKRFSALIYEE